VEAVYQTFLEVQLVVRLALTCHWTSRIHVLVVRLALYEPLDCLLGILDRSLVQSNSNRASHNTLL